MAIPIELPEQAPVDLIVGSRELLRGKVRGMQFLNLGTQTLLVVVLTWSATTDSLGAKAPYWILAIGGLLVGTGLAAAFTRGRTRSKRRQQQAVDRSWRYARAWAIPSARLSWKQVASIIGLLAVCTAVVLGVLWLTGWTYFHILFVPMLGASVGIWCARVLRTFRWATWFGTGAIDPDVASELARPMVKAQKVQHYAEVYAQNHPPTSDAAA